MTLAKAIEAAREALQFVKDNGVFVGESSIYPVLRKEPYRRRQSCNLALAALPDKPMSEEEILAIMVVIRDKNGTLRDMIRALKAANVLFVKED